MATIVTRAGKGSPLTSAELDQNQINLNTDKAELSGATFTGTVTANAGLVVDNITIDGTEIDLSSGDLTLDVAGNINLDADGGEFRFKDGGTLYATAYQGGGGSFYLASAVQDKDLIFQGNDGGSTITMVTFDASAAGAATFNNTISTGNGGASGKIAITGNTAVNEATHVTFTNSANTESKVFAIGAGREGVSQNGFAIRNVTDNTFPFVIENSGAATFSSSVTAIDLNLTSASPVIRFTETDQSNKNYMLGSFGSAFAIYDNTASQYRYIIDTNGNHIFNEGGVDVDFRVESNSNANMLFVDGGNNTVNVGVSSGYSGATLSVAGSTVLGNGNQFVIGTFGSSGLQLIGQAGGDNVVGTMGASEPLVFRTGSAERFRIASDGSLSTPTSGNSNVRFGANAGNSIASGGNQNTVIGDEAGTAITTGDGNTAVGFEALKTEDANGKNSAIGFRALKTLNAGTDANNTAVGYNAGLSVTTGIQNTLIGSTAGDALTDSDFNVAIGYQALSADTLGTSSIAIGYNALRSQNFTSATNSQNTVIGHNAGQAVTTGEANVFVGQLVGADQTTGAYNVALGSHALRLNTVASQNVAIGHHSLYSLEPSSAANTLNTAVGYHSGKSVTTGVNNTFVGGLAGDAAQTVSFSSLFGQGIACGDTSSNECNGFGYAITAASGYTTIGVGTHDIRAAHGNVTWATVSDERYKKDIADSTAGLSFINALQPRTFKYKTLGELPETFSAYEADSTKVFKNSDTNHGFIAQEIKAAIDADSSIKDGFRLWDDRPDGSQEVAEAALIPVLTKAIQELSAQVDALTARIETLEG